MKQENPAARLESPAFRRGEEVKFRLWHPGDPTPDTAAPADPAGIASAYRNLDWTLAARR